MVTITLDWETEVLHVWAINYEGLSGNIFYIMLLLNKIS